MCIHLKYSRNGIEKYFEATATKLDSRYTNSKNIKLTNLVLWGVPQAGQTALFSEFPWQVWASDKLQNVFDLTRISLENNG